MKSVNIIPVVLLSLSSLTARAQDQAKILKDFFAEYQTKDFTIRHQGAKNDAQYAIGNLKTEKGDFRVYFLLKKVDQELLIHQIRIESDNGK
jgi:hypothetical protein